LEKNSAVRSHGPQKPPTLSTFSETPSFQRLAAVKNTTSPFDARKSKALEDPCARGLWKLRVEGKNGVAWKPENLISKHAVVLANFGLSMGFCPRLSMALGAKATSSGAVRPHDPQNPPTLSTFSKTLLLKPPFRLNLRKI
jgi:hypothetical protein